MRHRTCNRLNTLLLVVMSMLFSQLALASYVCPALVDVAAMSEMMAAGEPCEGMDPTQPVLCHQHSAATSQSFEAPQLLAASLPAVVQVLVFPRVLAAAQSGVVSCSATPEDRPPPDPLFLSTLRLRV
jgi:Flp pilus assembly protein CpaB